MIAIVRDRGNAEVRTAGRGRDGRGRGKPRERPWASQYLCGYTKRDDRCPGILTAGTD